MVGAGCQTKNVLRPVPACAGPSHGRSLESPRMTPPGTTSARPPDRRLRPIERMQRPREFQAVLKGGRCFRDPILRIHFLATGREFSRLGLVVSRKVGNSVERNRLKRIFREVFRAGKSRLPACHDVVFIPSPQEDSLGLRDYAAVFDRFAAWQASRTGPRPEART